MAEVSSTYTPRRGDRVKVTGTYEGTLESPYALKTDQGDLLALRGHRGDPQITETIEPLPDPEPKWKYGTVVKTPSYLPFIKGDDGWTSITRANVHYFDEVISKAWREGTLEILYTPED